MKLGFSLWDLFENKYEKSTDLGTTCMKIEGVESINSD